MTHNRVCIDEDLKNELISLIPHIRAFARYLCRDLSDAEDLAQEALVKAWNALDSFKAGTNMKAWTFMIARNQFYSDKRRSWRTTPLSQDVAERTLKACSNPTANLELDEVRRAMARLSPDQREALILVAAGGLSYEQASIICDRPIGTIKSRVSRARDRLEELLETGDYGQDGLSAASAAAHIFAELSELSQVKPAA